MRLKKHLVKIKIYWDTSCMLILEVIWMWMTSDWFHGSRQLSVLWVPVGPFDPTLSVSVTSYYETKMQCWPFRQLYYHTLLNQICMNLTENTTLFVLFHFLLSAHIALLRLISQVLRFVFLLLCFFTRVQIRPIQRQLSQLLHDLWPAVVSSMTTTTTQYFAQYANH